jgi:hypothetical protein
MGESAVIHQRGCGCLQSPRRDHAQGNEQQIGVEEERDAATTS